MEKSELISRARETAAGILKDHTRYDGTPFIGHPDAVAGILADEIGLPVRENNLILPCGASGRWSAERAK